MKIATFNVNGIKARIETVPAWLTASAPDVAVLQEIKSVDESFPREVFEDLGYRVETHGQKGFNGVAILSKLPLEDVLRGLPGGNGDDQARWIEATVIGTRAVRVCGLYLPNGNPVGTDKYPYKLGWMDRLASHAAELLKLEEPLVLAGDYNVIPEPGDCHDPGSWADDALFLPQTRARFRELLNLGLTDAVRATTNAERLYTFWDYQAGAWQKNNGIRIDHLLLSAQATDRLAGTTIHKHVRGWEKPSDHVPVSIDIRA